MRERKVRFQPGKTTHRITAGDELSIDAVMPISGTGIRNSGRRPHAMA